MKGYKAFYFDMSCRPTLNNSVKYVVGETFEIDEPIILCCRGFHFCPRMPDVYRHYPARFDTRICEVEALGSLEPKCCWKRDSDGGIVSRPSSHSEKLATDKLYIARELTPAEIKGKLDREVYIDTCLETLEEILASIRDFRESPETWELFDGYHWSYDPNNSLKELHDRADLWEKALTSMDSTQINNKEEKKE